jgi:hypothetical protein
MEEIDFGELGSSNMDGLFKLERKEDKRKTLFHITTHMLAFFIIVPWILLQLSSIEVGQTYNTIVSVVVGFYFGKNLFKNN